MHKGYIKLWRKFEDWYGAGNPYRLSLWVWILKEAQHKPQRKIFKKQIMTINPGQFLTGRKYLSQKTGISESYIEKLLNEFKKEKMLEQQKSTKNRLITITNWKDYQFRDNNEDNARDNTETTQRQHRDTSKNVKNVKNVKKTLSIKNQVKDTKNVNDKNYRDDIYNIDSINSNVYSHLNDKAFNDLWISWLSNRTAKKILNTKHALKIALKKLQAKPLDVAISMLEAAVERGWRGIFDIKEENKKQEKEGVKDLWLKKQSQKEHLQND